MLAAAILMVQICNFSRADSQMLARAEAIAQKIYADAGIETVWSTADDPVHPAGFETSRITLQVYPGHPKRTNLREAFGVAMADPDPKRSFLANIFLGSIDEIAFSRTDETVLLGYVMAHEVGHLLGLPHTPGTIMSESWAAKDILKMQAGRVQFTAAQSTQLRTAVERR
jgi:hypothetical protein